MDQDNTAGDSMNDLLGIGTANGVSAAAAESYIEQLANATLQQAIASSCYWSLYGDQCTTGYFDVTEAHGQVAGIQENSVCTGDEVQTLYCAPGTTMGTCQWEGFRGVGDTGRRHAASLTTGHRPHGEYSIYLASMLTLCTYI